MTDGRKAGDLSETTKKYLQEIYIEEVYGRSKDITSKFLEKGVEIEGKSRALATTVTGKYVKHNEERLENKFITGLPDSILDKEVVDLKSSWDIWTFTAVDGTNKDYYWQLQGYMKLTGKKFGRLIYCLIDTPEHLIYDEVRRTSYKVGALDGSPEYEELEKKIRINLTYEDIPAEKRIKQYVFSYNEEDIKRLYTRIDECRKYLKSLSF